jgi:hypothetical protein
MKSGEFNPSPDSLLVEMSGIEPESERLVPRISTSVACCSVSPEGSQQAEIPSSQPPGPESPSFAREATWRAALRLCCARPDHRPENGIGGRDPTDEGQLLAHRLCSEGQSSVVCAVGTLVCADFSRSAPLGSQSGASLSRRSLSSPCVVIISLSKPRKFPVLA